MEVLILQSDSSVCTKIIPEIFRPALNALMILNLKTCPLMGKKIEVSVDQLDKMSNKLETSHSDNYQVKCNPDF